ncbi:MAG: RNA polymerase sigma factor [Deltaproteobacteria bacterium]|nr:RNA polymerase sigma factor [Deltaproteobacteria bacterium]
MTRVEEQQLLTRAKAGDRDALEALLSAHQARIYRFGLQLCRRPEDAEDVTQETLLALARSIRDFREESSLSTWLYSVARRSCRKRQQKSARAEEQTDPAELDVADETQRSPESDIELKRKGREIDRVLSALPSSSREILLLRDVEGLTTSEVAQVVGISEAAVKSRLHRARSRLRNELSTLVGDLQPPPRPDCPDILQLYLRQIDLEQTTPHCAQLTEHLSSCLDCMTACDRFKRLLAACADSSRRRASSNRHCAMIHRAVAAFSE